MRILRILPLLLAVVASTTMFGPDLSAGGSADESRAVYPNPFVEATKFQLSMPRQACITINVYDIKGGHIKTLWPNDGTSGCQTHDEGEYDIPWDGTDTFGEEVPPGVYVCVLVSDNVIVKSVKVVKAGLE